MVNKIQAHDYPVFIGDNEVFEQIDRFIHENGYADRIKILMVDENTMEHCYPLLMQNVPSLSGIEVFQVESGEENKTIEVCTQLWMALNEINADRKVLVMNLGGGVLGDMGGFVASTYKRGVDFINIPTTLLSQVDASVGGKLGVDLAGVKNIVGVFNNPKAVFVNTEFLFTLPAREVKSGFAEVIKHGLIQDKNYFEALKSTQPSDFNWNEIVFKSVNIKNDVVLEDPKEAGLRKVLNFGHTLGHGLETHRMLHGERLLHGEAIAVGMICAAYLSNKLSTLSADELQEISMFIKSYFPMKAIGSDEVEPILEYMLKDKKNEGKDIQFVLLDSIGIASYNHSIQIDDIKESINYFNSIL